MEVKSYTKAATRSCDLAISLKTVEGAKSTIGKERLIRFQERVYDENYIELTTCRISYEASHSLLPNPFHSGFIMQSTEDVLPFKVKLEISEYFL